MENIEVALRIRPQNFFERENNDIDVWTVLNNEILSIS